MTTPADSPAAVLRAAADRLRALADAAVEDTFRPDLPWHVEACDNPALDKCPCIVAQGRGPDSLGDPFSVSYVADAETPGIAALIAAMGPTVALALADWLEDAADGDDHGEIDPYALATARAVLAAGDQQ